MNAVCLRKEIHMVVATEKKASGYCRKKPWGIAFFFCIFSSFMCISQLKAICPTITEVPLWASICIDAQPEAPVRPRSCEGVTRRGLYIYKLLICLVHEDALWHTG